MKNRIFIWLLIAIVFFLSESCIVLAQNKPVKLISPIGGEIITNNKLDIQWENDSLNDSLSLYLWDGNQFTSITEKTTCDSGVFSTELPSNLSGDRFRVLIVRIEDGVESKTISPAYFSMNTISPRKPYIESSNIVFSDNLNILISPNPVADILYISGLVNPRVYPGDMNVSRIQIYNLMGIEVYTEPSEGLKPSEGFRIDVSGLPAGVYFIHIGDKVEKFVKM